MEGRPHVQPLPYKARKRTFLLLLAIFITSLPFLFLYATGYRFDIAEPTNVYSTGGLYIAVERTGAEIYIDGELVRETRAFRKAFYAQNIQPGTHRVHVQAEGYHTWVKELPVSKHLVTEAQAFNLPLVPNIRVIAPWQTATGTMVVRTPLLVASTTNPVHATTTKNTSALIQNTEYLSLYTYFATATPTSTVERTPTTRTRIDSALELTDTASTSTEDVATTTKESGGVRLYESDGDIYARWIGSFGSMPYYYCAEEFPRYSTTTEDEPNPNLELPPVPIPEEIENPEQPLMHPVQTVPENVVCDPAIRIDRKWQEYTNFDFFPGSSDLVVVALREGVYVVEIDDRGWQNMQPLIMGEDVRMHIENGTIYVYDGILIYQIVLDIS